MIYTYNITKNFLKELNTACNLDEANDILIFIKSHFIDKENVYFIGSENIWKNLDIKTEANYSLIKKLISFLNNEIGAFEGKSKNDVDFIFSGIDEDKYECKKKISCLEILNDSSLKNEIKKTTVDTWKGTKDRKDSQKKKRELHSLLKKIFKISDEVFLVDRHIPRTLYQNNKKHIESYKNSLNFFKNLLTQTNVKAKFYNGIDHETKKLISSKDLEAILIDFYSPLVSLNIPVMVKEGYDTYDVLHDRYVISIVDNNEVNFFEVRKGLNFLDQKNSIDSRIMTRLNKDIVDETYIEWNNLVEKQPNFIRFTIN
tara:strand:- start:597 stop:1541 length:945 start_codon:yes stop_codon:yes gene_type:complete